MSLYGDKSRILVMAGAMLLAMAACGTASTNNLITLNGKSYFINGANIPWNAFGTDAGSHPWWGRLCDTNWFNTFFAQCEQSGVNCVRFWIHCDGRASPEFDSNGHVTGLDATFLDDLESIFRIANNHKVMIMPCLWSFDMTHDNTGSAGPYAGKHADLIQDAAKTQSYIDNALIPIVRRFADTSNLFAWEISNEPEWSVVDQAIVTQAQLQRFCAMIAAAIHQNCDKQVTLGASCLKWNSDVSPAIGNWWNDAALRAQYNSPDAHLDFYQVHYYDWMYQWGYSPFDLNRPLSYWQLDKPVLIGETPGDNSGLYTIKQQLDNGYTNGYAGVMFWSYNSDFSTNWTQMKTELKAFRDAHLSVVDYSPDSDGDGMPDWWECRYFACLTVADGSPGCDHDHDGLCDRDEYIAGTNPTNAGSVLEVSSAEWQGAGIVLSWQSVSNKFYTVQKSTNLLSGFTERLVSNLMAHPPLNTYTATLDRAIGFYRIGVEP